MITILWVLVPATYIWSNYYTSRARDTARKSDLHNIDKSFIVRTSNTQNLPKPGNATIENIDGIEYEVGEFSDEAFEKMTELTYLPRDPKTKKFYSYKIPKNCDGYILTAHLENPRKLSDGTVSAEYSINTISNCRDNSELLGHNNISTPLPTNPNPHLPPPPLKIRLLLSQKKIQKSIHQKLFPLHHQK